ncbi:hypothetical protein [Rubrivirga sp.]|uniref:hypothetical protein n=1 Tax=Rubrivirga sp. TaxID=1885344 RepID=UPI003C77083E
MRLTVTVPDPVATDTRRLAADTDRSVSAVVAEALAAHLAGERRRRAFEVVDGLIGTTTVAGDVDQALDSMRAGADRSDDALGL